jgi:4-amino-4-deoxy-L-arabinose transferase-like glycosyltransferase
MRDAAHLVLLLAIGLVLRLPGIGAAPLDAHHVRQADTASIARVMARDGIDLLHPRIGWAGPNAGTVESEFPIYAAGTALGWKLLNSEDGSVPAWPRVLSILSWLVGGVALAVLLRRRAPDLPVWLPLLLYSLSPLAVLFSRAIQPDAMAVAFLLLGLERADAASTRGSSGLYPVLLAGVLFGLAIASKGTLAFWLPLLPVVAARRTGPGLAAVVASVGIASIMGAAWYLHAHLNLGADGASFKIWGASAGKWGTPGVWFDLGTWRYLVGTAVSHTSTLAGVVLLAAGCAEARREAWLRPWVLGVALGGVAMLVVTAGFRDHNYYQLPLVPFVSVLVGAGLAALLRSRRGWRRPVQGVVAGGLLLLTLLSLYQGRLFLSEGLDQDQRLAVVAASASAVLPPGVALVVVDRHPQTLLYALGQQGWHRQTLDLDELRQLEGWGANALLITDTSPAWSQAEFVRSLRQGRPLVARGEGWNLLRLRVGEPLGAVEGEPTPAVEGQPTP